MLARFCLKEAFYKAANGFVGRMISFQEVAVAAIDGDGRAVFRARSWRRTRWPRDGWVGQPLAGLPPRERATARPS